MIKYMPIEEAKSIYLINGRYHGSLGSYPIVQGNYSPPAVLFPIGRKSTTSVERLTP